MARNIFAGGGVQTFMGDNNPLYVQNMNSLKAAFTDLQNGTTATGPIGSVIMWSGDTSNIPAGYAVANGAYLNTVTYATLYNIIGIRYGALVGATFPLPNFTSNVPEGIIGAPTAPFTKTTSVSSAVDAHTHTVNGTINVSGAPNASLALAIVSGNADVHTHVGGLFTQGNANTHTHAAANLTAATANTITAPLPTHTHTTATTQIIFIIRVS
jgi:microcystin-dependent protein